MAKVLKTGMKFKDTEWLGALRPITQTRNFDFIVRRDWRRTLESSQIIGWLWAANIAVKKNQVRFWSSDRVDQIFPVKQGDVDAIAKKLYLFHFG